MADNVTIPTTGSGDPTPKIATDQIPTTLEHYQYIKVADGTPNSTMNMLVTGQREALVAERTLLFADTFNTSPDTNFWNTSTGTTLSGVSNNVSGGVLQLSTGTTANATARITSLAVLRLLPGSSNWYHAWVSFGDTGTANNVRNFGIYSTTDGYFFQLSSGGLSIGSRKASSDTLVPHGSFSENDFTMDTNYHKYEILVGANGAWFFVDGLIRHKLNPNVSAPYVNTTDFPLEFDDINTGGITTNLLMNVLQVGYWRIGQPTQRPRYRRFVSPVTNGVLKLGPGTLRRVIVNGSTAGTATFADNASSTAAGIITALNVTTGAGSGNSRNVELDLDFSLGLVMTTTAGFDITVVWD